MDENHTANSEQHRQYQPDAALPILGPVEQRQERKQLSKARKRKTKRRKELRDWSEWGFDCLLVIVTFLNWWIASEALQATKTAANAAIKATEISRSTLEQMIESGESSAIDSNRAVNKVERIASANERALGQSQKAMTQYQKSTAQDQRAYMVFAEAELLSDAGEKENTTSIVKTAVIKAIKANEPFTVTLTIKNVGRSPAKNVTIVAKVGFVDTRTRLEMDRVGEKEAAAARSELAQFASPRDFAPNESFKTFAAADRGFITLAELNRLRTAQQMLAVAGVISYQDIFGDRKETEFCLMFVGGTDQYQFCKGFNTIQ